MEGRLHRIEDHLEQLPDQDWEDNAIESEMDQVFEGLGHAGNAEIQAIYAALARLKGGIYGVCARCGDDIVLTFDRIHPCAGPVRARSRRRARAKFSRVKFAVQHRSPFSAGENVLLMTPSW